MVQHVDQSASAAWSAVREQRLAEEEARRAELERRSASCLAEAWRRAGHRLAAEVHEDAARRHRRNAEHFGRLAEPERDER